MFVRITIIRKSTYFTNFITGMKYVIVKLLSYIISLQVSDPVIRDNADKDTVADVFKLKRNQLKETPRV